MATKLGDWINELWNKGKKTFPPKFWPQLKRLTSIVVRRLRSLLSAFSELVPFFIGFIKKLTNQITRLWAAILWLGSFLFGLITELLTQVTKLRAWRFGRFIIAILVLVILDLAILLLLPSFPRSWPFVLEQALVILILSFGFWRCYHRWRNIKHTISNGVKKVWEKTCYFVGIFVALCFGYLIYKVVIKELLHSPLAWIIFLSVALFVLWLLVLFFKKKLEEKNAGRQVRKGHTTKGQSWETIAEISLAVGTIILAFITMHHSEATKDIAKEIKSARLHEMRPRLETGFLAELDSAKTEVSFDLVNTGRGKAFQVTIALRHYLEKNRNKWKSARSFLGYPPIMPDSSRRFTLSLGRDFDTTWDFILKAYVLYKDVENREYLTIAPLVAYPCTAYVPSEFWDRLDGELRKKKHKYEDSMFYFIPKHLDSTSIYEE